MPLQPQVGAELELDIETKIKKDRLGGRYSREDGGVVVKWVFAWDNRQDDEKDELMEFWFDHRKTQQFYMVDVEGNIINKVWFNSSIKRAFNGAQRWAMSAAFEGMYEAVPYYVEPPPPPEPYYLTGGGQTLGGSGGEDLIVYL